MIVRHVPAGRFDTATGKAIDCELWPHCVFDAAEICSIALMPIREAI